MMTKYNIIVVVYVMENVQELFSGNNGVVLDTDKVDDFILHVGITNLPFLKVSEYGWINKEEIANYHCIDDCEHMIWKIIYDIQIWKHWFEVPYCVIVPVESYVVSCRKPVWISMKVK